MPKVWQEKSMKDTAFLRLVGCGGEVVVIVADADGKELPGGHVATFQSNGKAYFNIGIDEESAVRAGIVLDGDGRIAVEPE